MKTKDYISLTVTLVVIAALGSLFFYSAFLELAKAYNINSEIVVSSLKYTFGIALTGIGIWLISPVKVRIYLEALVRELAQTKNNLSGLPRGAYKDSFADKAASTKSQIIGLILLLLSISLFLL